MTSNDAGVVTESAICPVCGWQVTNCFCPCPNCGKSTSVPTANPDACQCSYEVLSQALLLAKRSISEGNAFALAQRTAEALDAERYRYLRSAAGQWDEDEDGPMVCDGLGDAFEFLRGVEVDESVDRAMAAWKAAGNPIIKNPAEVGIEGHEPGKRDSAPGERVVGPACATDRESGTSHSAGPHDEHLTRRSRCRVCYGVWPLCLVCKDDAQRTVEIPK